MNRARDLEGYQKAFNCPRYDHWSWIETAFGRVLDLGCGRAMLQEDFLKKYPHASCVGLDIDPSLIPSFSSSYHCIIGDASALPFPDETFDAILSAHMLQYLDIGSQSECLREAHRILKPGGKALFVYLGIAYVSQDLLATLDVVLDYQEFGKSFLALEKEKKGGQRSRVPTLKRSTAGNVGVLDFRVRNGTG